MSLGKAKLSHKLPHTEDKQRCRVRSVLGGGMEGSPERLVSHPGSTEVFSIRSQDSSFISGCWVYGGVRRLTGCLAC